MVADTLCCKKKVALRKPPVWDEQTLTKLRRLGAMLSMSLEGMLVA